MNSKIFEMHGSVLGLSNDSTFNIPNDPSIDIAKLTEGDNDPMFVNVEVLRGGISGNRRVYENRVVETVNNMIVGVMGYLGHPDPDKHGFEFREPQCIYVGSQIQEIAGVKTSIGKAYIFQNSPLREWIPKSLVVSNPMTVSINALGNVVDDTLNKLKHVREITKLESIDWANPGTEGMSTSGVISIVKEMNRGDGEMHNINKEDIIKNVSISEMKAFNPGIVENLVKGITIAELKDTNSSLYGSIVEIGRITEMTLSVDGKEETVKLDKIQELFNGKQTEIDTLQTKITEMELEATKSKLLIELVPDQYTDKVASRIVGITEQQIRDSIKTELEYITEISGASFDNLPKGKLPKGDDSTIVNDVKNLFGVVESK